MTTHFSLPKAAPAIELAAAQQAALAEIAGHQLVLGAAGSGRTSVALAACQRAISIYGQDQVWAIAASRHNTNLLKEKLIALDPNQVPKVFTVAGLTYALLRAAAVIKTAGEVELKMLTGPQQESRIRNLISSTSINWPAKWQQAINTKVFASDLRRWIDISRSSDHPHSDSTLNFTLQSFIDSLSSQAELAAELTYTEANLAAADLLASEIESRFLPQAVIVDDLHDFDPSQLRFLIALIQNVTYSLVTSNPDAAVLGFRGADISITKRYRDQITPTTHILDCVYRHGENIRKVVLDFLPSQIAPDLSSQEANLIRNPKLVNALPDSFEIELSAAAGIRDNLIIDRIMRAKVDQQIEFSDIAIVGRSFNTLSDLRRMLAEAAIPVEYSPDNLPLAKDPAVEQLLNALKLAVDLSASTDADQLIRFLTSDIAGVTTAQLRRTAQLLRGHEIFGSTNQVISAVLTKPSLLAELPFDPQLQPIRRAAAILHTLARELTKQPSLNEALWSIWQAKISPEVAAQLGYDSAEDWENWPTRLAGLAQLPSAAGRKADRDLDAVLALFDAADRSDRNYQGSQSVADFVTELFDQDATSDVLIQRANSGVAVITAHRARGRQWGLVIMVDLQEGIWPAGNVRESIIEPRDAAQQRARLAEEQRLAASGAAAASNHLVLAVIDSKLDQGEAPSSLLANFELPTEVISTAPPSMLTPRGLITQLRVASVDPSISENLRNAAVARLAYLAKLQDSRFSAANPKNWWFVAEQTQSDRPIVNQEDQLQISGSMLQSITRCPTQWFFERKLKLQEEPIASTVIGLAIHAVAEKLVSKSLSITAAISQLENSWPETVFDAPWQSKIQFVAAKNMLTALNVWLTNQSASVTGTEYKFEVLHADLDVVLVGHIDLLLESENAIEVVDYKTSAVKPSNAEMSAHSQLGVYQLAVSIDQQLNPSQKAVTAKLVQIRARNAKDQVVEQVATDLTDQSWLIEQIKSAKVNLLTEDLPARPGQHCRNCKVRKVCPAVPEGDQVTA